MSQLAQKTSEKSDTGKVTFYGHNRIVYWWPLWFFGYILAFIGFIDGYFNVISHAKGSSANWYTLFCLCYVFMMFFVFFFTNIKTGANAAVVIFFAGIIVLLAMYIIFGQINVFSGMPDLLVFMNANFFLVFSTGLLVIWIFVFIIDKRYSSVISNGILSHNQPFKKQTTTLEEVKVIRTHSDIPCHYILGLWMFGDIEIEKGGDKVTIYNVAFVRGKAEQADYIIAAGQVAPTKGHK